VIGSTLVDVAISFDLGETQAVQDIADFIAEKARQVADALKKLVEDAEKTVVDREFFRSRSRLSENTD
jgi:hypothetical protein